MSIKAVLILTFVVIFCQLSQSAPNYSGCGDEYRCFVLGDEGCLKAEKCQVLLKTLPQEGTGTVEFDLYWNRPSNSSDNWVAAALSKDNMMGNDSASIFAIDYNQTGRVTYQEALTFVKKDGSRKAGFKPCTVTGVNVTRHVYKNGVLHAKWTRTPTTTVDSLTFNMKTNKYFVLLAYGPIKDGKFQHHSDQGSSDAAVDLETEPVATNTTTVIPATSPPSNTSQSIVTVVSTTSGNSTVGSTSKGTSTGTTNNSTQTPSKATPSTAHPTGTTMKPGGSASTITMSLFLAIFAALLMFIN